MGIAASRRSVSLFVAGIILGLPAAVPSTLLPASAQTEPPAVIKDSIDALGGLVGKAGGHCQLRDAADDEIETNTELPYVKCDDGLPASGGGANGIPVPVAYTSNASGDDYSKLPLPADETQRAEKVALYDLQPDEPGDRVTLDVDITMPAAGGIAGEYEQPWKLTKTPKDGFPVVVLMHGCCGGNKNSWEATTVDGAAAGAEGESWHQSNAWFAARGYVVINYTARGFRNMNDEGSSGTTQLDSRRYEINDYQYLVGLLVDHDQARRAAGLKPIFNVNPRKVAAVGGSYGGGFAWLALTDPKWKSPATRTPVKVAAAAPRYGWTDLLEALVPSGHYLEHDHDTGRTIVPPATVEDAVSRHPIGVAKQSIVSLLYASGNLMATNHTTFPAWMHSAFQRLQAGEPYDGDAELEEVAGWFLSDRSAYYQERFWTQVSKRLRVPAFIAATWTDPLFTTGESGVRFYNKLKRMVPDYPVQMYLGDYQHFTANKVKEWADICGDDHHVCRLEDYRTATNGLNLGYAASRVRVGATTRMNRFLDHYLKGQGRTPKRQVWATTTICAANATEGLPVDEPGIEYVAPSWRALAPDTTVFRWKGGGLTATTTSTAATDNHAQESDAGYRQTQANKCFTTSTAESSPGVVQYVSEPIGQPFTMIGLPSLKLTYTATTGASDHWVAARLYDKAADGTMTMVTRGVCRVATATAPDVTCEIFQLWGNAWTFEKDHTLVLEVTQSDTPMFRRNNFPSSLSFEAADLRLPTTRETFRRDFRD
jgi:predicted acyl esterase